MSFHAGIDYESCIRFHWIETVKAFDLDRISIADLDPSGLY